MPDCVDHVQLCIWCGCYVVWVGCVVALFAGPTSCVFDFGVLGFCGLAMWLAGVLLLMGLWWGCCGGVALFAVSGSFFGVPGFCGLVLWLAGVLPLVVMMLW